MGALGGGNDCQGTMQTCLTCRVLSHAIGQRAVRSHLSKIDRKISKHTWTLNTTIDRFLAVSTKKSEKSNRKKVLLQHHGAPKPLPKHLQCTPLALSQAQQTKFRCKWTPRSDFLWCFMHRQNFLFAPGGSVLQPAFAEAVAVDHARVNWLC